MTAAMMLPSSLGFIRLYAATAGRAPDFPLAIELVLERLLRSLDGVCAGRVYAATCSCTESSMRGRGWRRTRR